MKTRWLAVTVSVALASGALAATPVDYARPQTEALARKLDVSYRRAFVAEVAQDLEHRAGLRVAFPRMLGEGWTWTLEAKGLTAKDILQKLAADGKFDLDLGPDVAVLTQKADDKTLADLEKQLANPDRWERCKAVWALGNLADPRIYPLLAKGLADKDAGVVEWTLKALENHGDMGLVMANAEKAAVAAAVATWLKEVLGKDDRTVAAMFAQHGGYVSYWTFGLVGHCRNGRLDLLASTGRPEALKLLVETVRAPGHAIVRGAAATALGNSRQAADALLAALKDVEKQIADAQALYDKITAETAPKKKGQPIVVTGSTPNAKAYAEVAAGELVKRQVMLALLKMRSPEALKDAQDWVSKGTSGRWDAGLLPALLDECGSLLDFSAVAKRELDSLPPLYEVKEKVTAPSVGVAIAGLGKGTAAAYRAVYSVKLLAAIPDPAVRVALLKLATHTKAFEALAGAGAYDTGLALPADDPEMVAALIARLAEGGASTKLAAQSLAASHDPKAADALIALLKNPDPELVATLAKALAQTRDPRALGVLVALAREKHNWPDLEAEDRARLAAGKAVRMRTNPRRAIVLAMEETRDPKAFAELAALAQDDALPAEVTQTARRCLRSAATTQADVAALVALTRAALPKAQLEILAHVSSGQAMWWSWGAREPSPRCAGDPRWVELLAGRVWDDEAFWTHRGKRARNFVLDALAAIKTPVAERAVVILCHDPDKDLAALARKALDGYNDPEAAKITLGTF